MAGEAARAPSGARSKVAYSGRLLLRMPASLHAQLAELARRQGVSLNQLITDTLAEAAGTPSENGFGRPAPRQRGLRLVLVANLIVLAIAAGLAIAVLVLALR